MRFFYPVLLTVVAVARNSPAQSDAGAFAGENFWKTTGKHVGSSACAACHPAQSKTYAETTMQRALTRITEVAPLPGNVDYTWREKNIAYRIQRVGPRLMYRVTNGTETLETPLLYSFGEGMAGMTFVYERNGQYYESRVSYYAELRGLDLTVGSTPARDEDLTRLAGRAMNPQDARECFGCHTTGARHGKTFQLVSYEPGVRCENCHGPGGDHVAAKSAGTIRSWKGLDAQDMSDACGACHRTWEKVLWMGVKGEDNVRFAPYRLTMSKCFAADDARISCTACHNPHAKLEIVTAKYDGKCLACHANGIGTTPLKAGLKAGAKACPKANSDCASCHMPKVSPPGTHHAFVDHRIRIARKDGIYPE